MKTQSKIYTRKGRGGKYEYLGVARGAGTSKGSAPLVVYRDMETGALLYREPENFNFRMQQIQTGEGAV